LGKEGTFVRPRFSAAKFRFYFAKSAARKGIALAPTTHAQTTTRNSYLLIY